MAVKIEMQNRGQKCTICHANTKFPTKLDNCVLIFYISSKGVMIKGSKMYRLPCKTHKTSSKIGYMCVLTFCLVDWEVDEIMERVSHINKKFLEHSIAVSLIREEVYPRKETNLIH